MPRHLARPRTAPGLRLSLLPDAPLLQGRPQHTAMSQLLVIAGQLCIDASSHQKKHGLFFLRRGLPQLLFYPERLAGHTLVLPSSGSSCSGEEPSLVPHREEGKKPSEAPYNRGCIKAGSCWHHFNAASGDENTGTRLNGAQIHGSGLFFIFIPSAGNLLSVPIRWERGLFGLLKNTVG